jgi:hypothetical protein
MDKKLTSKEYKLDKKIITYNRIRNFLILNDGRLSFSNGKLFIINLNGKIELEIEKSDYHTQLSNGDIISSLENGSMKIIRLLQNNLYKIIYEFESPECYWNNKVLELENGNILSLYSNSTLIVWEKNKYGNEKKKYYIKDKIILNKFSFEYYHYEYNNIIKTNKDEYVYTNSAVIIFLDIKDKISVVLKNKFNYQISSGFYNMLKIKNLLLICAREGIIIYDLKKRQEKEIVKLEFEKPTSIINLSNGNILFGAIEEINKTKKIFHRKGGQTFEGYTEIYKYSLFEYQYNGKFLKINQIKNASDSENREEIIALIELNNIIISGGSDVYFWSYKNKGIKEKNKKKINKKDFNRK